MFPLAIRFCSSILATASALPSTRAITRRSLTSSLPARSSFRAKAQPSGKSKSIAILRRTSRFPLHPNDVLVYTHLCFGPRALSPLSTCWSCRLADSVSSPALSVRIPIPDCVPLSISFPAHARNRHSHGARRPAPNAHRHVRPPRLGTDRHRCGLRTCRGHRRNAPHVFPALQSEPPPPSRLSSL